ncbi:protein fem-1 homolog A isoform X2 [Ooceraea biroi]|uniref:protein fem-1 homolog A isoform X2 n=1 Tax=Ooceraea biroi TaxID=2015173 RepID=UPI0005BA8A90|nr:protein fem-1 homolog A isoform X2 [Ooceraea biroi]
MWISTTHRCTFSMDQLFHDLINECKYQAPGAQLTYALRNQLEKYKQEERKEIVSRMKDGCAPLFIACKRGHVDIVEYLIQTCDADIEQRGKYEVPDDRSVHCVTPLWCAAVSGNLEVIKCLISHGADINAVSDSGSTPVRSACFMTHMDIVSYLVEKGADILKANYNGGTCLINSVQSVELCTFLLEHGADVNATDIQNKTALHYAIQEHRFHTTKLLLEHNADPHLRSRYNDDALQTACLKGAIQIFEYLVEKVSYPPERLADANELMGSTFFDDHNDTHMTLQFWRAATAIRLVNSVNETPLPKRPVLPKREAYKNATEFSAMEELNSISHDVDALRIQSLLICERILGAHHKDTLFRLMFRGASYADALRYQNCIDLWHRALEIRVEKDSILYADTCFTAQALLRLMVDLNEKRLDVMIHNQEKQQPRFCDVVAIFKLLSSQLTEARELLETIFPHLDVVKLLLDCGASVDDRNILRSTPLHIASSAYNFQNALIQLLLDYGAHLDTPNRTGDTPARLICANPLNNIAVVKHISLQCQAAQAICKYGICTKELPITLSDFLDLHRD